jgi:hypothetical protein
MRIPICRGETFSTNQEGRTIALLVAHKWRAEGKQVEIKEGSSYITVSYTELDCLTDQEARHEAG